ncbi:MAG TPA: autotransporter-associated beta strand repeat-containing protein [Chthoniobacterales bacterium]|jgi:autotransporter-associated beta strand protein
MKKILIIISSLTLITQLALAGSATWSASPGTDNWNTATNWVPSTIPNGTSDIATFDFSNSPEVTVTGKITVNSTVFSSAANAYTITDDSPQTMTISGAGISNNSGIGQHFQINDVAEMDLTNSATITGPIVIDVMGDVMSDSTAGSLVFKNTTNAGEATLTAEPTHSIYAANINFYDTSTASNAVITAKGKASADQLTGGVVAFFKRSTAADATITCEGSAVLNGPGACFFYENSEAGSATIIANGGTSSGAEGGIIHFNSGATANSTLIANGGTNGGSGGQLQIDNSASGTQPRIELFGNSILLISASVTIGSLEGEGTVTLKLYNLSIGANGLSTTFSGIFQDGTFAGGAITKIGAGTLTLLGASLNTGGATVNQGTLLVSNQTGSGTGTGPVQVNAGTLGGSGIIAGAVTVGTGTGAGAVLAPAADSRTQTTLTTQGTLTLLADSTYKCSAKGRGHEALTDSVVANGATITGARFAFRPRIVGTLQAGTVFTVISNTSANPISGNFTNLADGAVLTVSGTHFQASYEGGDGNDLTLTVVP